MSHSISFAEMVNLAIGTPELGSVNFNALHLFLHSLLDQLHLRDTKREITEAELDFIKPQAGFPASVAASAESVPVARKSSSIFHQMHERILAIERQLHFLNDIPDTEQLLARSQGQAQPAQDMWQIMQLKKKMEVNEEGMMKAMKTLQDLLSNIYSLKSAAATFEEELGQLKEGFTKLNLGDTKEQLLRLDEQAKLMEGLREQLESVTSGAFLDSSDLVHWSNLLAMLTGKTFSEKEKEGREKMSREVLAVLGQLPEKHEALRDQMARLEAQMKHQPERGGLESPSDMKAVLERMDQMQRQEEQRKESLQGAMEQLQALKDQCEKLQRGVEQMSKSTGDIQTMRLMLEQLDTTKADKALIQEEMRVKADKSALEAMVNHGELQVATTQLSEMMHDLLQKMSLQDKDWQKALEKLFTDMDCKLDRMALDPLSKQLEEVWKFIKKFLSEGPRFDADSAAGFKKQLFERVKCISCDRPVTMMTGPHMITVRKAHLRQRPASANGYEYLQRPQRNRNPEAPESTSQPPLQTCWQCQAHHQPCTIKRLSRSQDLFTVYPYGDPTALTYDSNEVDILGVNGVLYKGRLSSQAGERLISLQKEFAAIKPPRPPSKMERARSAFADFSASSAAPSIRKGSPAMAGLSGSSRQQHQQLTFESMDGTVTTVTTSLSQSHLRNGGGVAGM